MAALKLRTASETSTDAGESSELEALWDFFVIKKNNKVKKKILNFGLKIVLILPQKSAFRRLRRLSFTRIIIIPTVQLNV